MRTKDHLESFLYLTKHELDELGLIHWPLDRNKLEDRINSLQDFIKETRIELKVAKLKKSTC